MPNDILFPDVDPSYIFDQDCLAFVALVKGKRVECLVTLEFLMAHFGAREPSEQAMRQAYQEHWASIQAIARNHIESGWIDEENRIYLTTRFTRLTVTFGERFHENADLRTLAETGQRMLTEIIGPNAEEVIVEWDVEDQPQGLPCVTLRIADPSLSVSGKGVLGPKVWQDHTMLSLTLSGIWSAMLRGRSRKLILKMG